MAVKVNQRSEKFRSGLDVRVVAGRAVDVRVDISFVLTLTHLGFSFLGVGFGDWDLEFRIWDAAVARGGAGGDGCVRGGPTP